MLIFQDIDANVMRIVTITEVPDKEGHTCYRYRMMVDEGQTKLAQDLSGPPSESQKNLDRVFRYAVTVRHMIPGVGVGDLFTMDLVPFKPIISITEVMSLLKENP